MADNELARAYVDGFPELCGVIGGVAAVAGTTLLTKNPVAGVAAYAVGQKAGSMGCEWLANYAANRDVKVVPLRPQQPFGVKVEPLPSHHLDGIKVEPLRNEVRERRTEPWFGGAPARAASMGPTRMSDTVSRNARQSDASARHMREINDIAKGRSMGGTPYMGRSLTKGRW
jgi:hypothetical protein